MKNLKIKFGLFSLLAIFTVSVFLTSCEQDIITEPADVVSVEEMTALENVTDIEEQIRISGKKNKDCVTQYFIPFDNKITNAEEANNYFASLSEEQKTEYLLSNEEIANRDPNDYCGPWEEFQCLFFDVDCYFDTCGYQPARVDVVRICNHGVQRASFCWSSC